MKRNPSPSAICRDQGALTPRLGLAGTLDLGGAACGMPESGNQLDGRSIPEVEIRYVGMKSVHEDCIRNFIASSRETDCARSNQFGGDGSS